MGSSIRIVEREFVPTFSSYVVMFHHSSIHAQYTRSPEVVNTWVEVVERLSGQRPLLVGINARYAHKDDELAVIQLCVGRSCMLFQVCRCTEGFPERLREFFLDKQIIFVGVGVRVIKRILERDYGVELDRIVELDSLAAEQRQNEALTDNTLEELCMTLLKRNISKPVEVLRSRWTRKKLSSTTIQFAIIDAFISHKIGEMLNPTLELRHLSLEKLTQTEVEARERVNRFWRYRVSFYDEDIKVAIDSGQGLIFDSWLRGILKLYRRQRDRLVFGIHTQGQNKDVFQICLGKNCVFIQMGWGKNRRIEGKLRDFLTNEQFTYVGFNSQSILEWLRRDHRIHVQGRVYDVRTLAAQGNRDNSLLNLELGALHWKLVQQSILKPSLVQRSNWASLQLNEEQIKYGCLDPYACFNIGTIFLNV